MIKTYQRTKAQVHADYKLQEDAEGLLTLEKAFEKTRRAAREAKLISGKAAPYIESEYRNTLDEEIKRQRKRASLARAETLTGVLE